MVAFKFLTFLVLIAFIDKSRSFDFYEELQNLNLEETSLVLNSTCIEDIQLIFDSLDKLWALTMLDASAKVPNGLLKANLVHIGQFDECLGVTHPNGHFKGKHCLAEINLHASVLTNKGNMQFINKAIQKDNQKEENSVALPPLKYGICLPSTCSGNDMTQILNAFNITDIEVAEKNCYTNDPVEFSAGSWAVLTIILILFGLTVFSTSYELYQKYVAENAKPKPILIAFSMYSNIIGLFEIRDNSGEMACLHGMRTLSMLWVILGHTFQMISSYPTQNLLDATDVLTDNNYIVVTNGYYSVDSFFFLSGLLVAFVFFRNMSKVGYYDAPVSYIHRYIRLTPPLLLVLFLNMTVMKDLRNGPQWGYLFEPISESCRETWWSIILYIQNYAQPTSVCLSQGWYLPCDMQMFWIAPIVLYPIYFWPKIGMGFWSFLTIGSTLLTFVMAYINDYKANLTVTVDANELYYDYITTHTRVMPWLVGIALGVAICHIKQRKIAVNLSKTIVILGWLFSTLVCLAILYGFANLNGNHSPSAVESAIFISFTRLGWGVGLAWIVFACIFGYGGWANSFLSWNIFQPLGKLSYHVYIIHITVLFWRVATYRTNINFDNMNIAFEYIGVVILSYLLSIVIYLVLDAPFAIIDRQLLSKIKIFPYPQPKAKKTENDVKAERGEINNAFENNKKI